MVQINFKGFLNMMSWIHKNYEIIAGIIVPIIIAIMGLFKIIPMIRKKQINKGDNNNLIQTEKNVENCQSLNQNSLIAAPKSTQNLVNGDQITNNFADMQTLEAITCGFISTMYPHTEKAFTAQRLTALKFLKILEDHFEKLSTDEKDKFSEADVQIVLQNAIKGAASKDLPEKHQLLAKLLVDRVQKSSSSIAELAINESIEIAPKLDANLIKILSLSFMFSRTKFLNLRNEQYLFEKLKLASDKFGEIDISTSKFEYLESIRCGKLINFTHNGLVDIISKSYPHLFLKEIPIEQIEKFNLSNEIKSLSFIEVNNKYKKFNPIIGLHIFEDQQLAHTQCGTTLPIVIDTNIKENFKKICSDNKLSANEINHILHKNVPNFQNIINIWDKGGFSKFSLTTAGIAIGRAHLEQLGFGNYDINIWIN